MADDSVTIADFQLGLEGLAILRRWGDAQDVTRRHEEIAWLLARACDREMRQITFQERGVVEGYTTIAAAYDDDSRNMIIQAEQPVVRRLLDEQPPGRALDAACGTGRHAAFLVERGHQVVGVDQTPAMLQLARAKAPLARFELGTLEALPVDDDTIDLGVCALALTHVDDLAAAINELARVTRKGGRLIISDVHPVACQLGLQAFETGGGRFVRNRVRSHAEYLAAFRACRLEVGDCIEPTWSEELIEFQPWASAIPDAAREALLGVPLVLIWDLAAG